MNPSITINGRKIGAQNPCYIVAEMSANHNQSFEQAVKIIEAAKEAGADAIKLQTYTPDTMTLKSDREPFQIKGTLWEGRNLYDLYGEAHTPWDWHPKLDEVAKKLKIDLFSTPFDDSAVDFLESLNSPVYKVASFEIVDIPLLRKIAKTGKPVIMSTGMATIEEIEEAVKTLRDAGNKQLVLLKCTSAYPAPPEDINLKSMAHLAEKFGVAVGLSDHTLGITVPVAATALGACVIEKHFTLSRSTPGPDSAFSLEPQEFKAMVDAVRTAEKALGTVRFGVGEAESKSRAFRRSLFVVKDIKAGEVFSSENVRSIRPGNGLHPRYLDRVIGSRAKKDLDRGTPLSLGDIEGLK